MTARRVTAGRIIGKRKVAGATLAIATVALLLATGLPQRLSSAVGGSAALAELAARSPGARIGGVALKAKAPRSALAPVADAVAPAGGTAPGPAVASVLGSSVGPEGPVPTSGPLGPGGFPSDFLAPAVPGAPDTLAGGAPGAGPGVYFGIFPGPPIGGVPIFAPGGPGGGIPGGGTPGGGTPGGGTLPPPLPPPGSGPIPEPSVWLMLMAGFAVIGGAMRRSRRVRFA